MITEGLKSLPLNFIQILDQKKKRPLTYVDCSRFPNLLVFPGKSSMFSVIRIGNHVHVKSSGVGDTCSEMPDPQAMQNLLMPNPRY